MAECDMVMTWGILFPWVWGGVGHWPQRRPNLAGSWNVSPCLVCVWPAGVVFVVYEMSQWYVPRIEWAVPSAGGEGHQSLGIEHSQAKEKVKDLQLPTFDQASSSDGVGGDFVLPKGEEELIPVGITHSFWVRLCQLFLLNWSNKLSKAIMWIWLKCSVIIWRQNVGRLWQRVKGAQMLNCQGEERYVLDMLSWLHCFSLYAAVLCSKHPSKSKELWVYQVLMINEAKRWWWTWLADLWHNLSSADDFTTKSRSINHYMPLYS